MDDDTAQVAQALARAAHAGQLDKQGRDYAEAHLAPIAASLRPFGVEAEAAGWLHDVLEDTDVTGGQLRAAGLPEVVVEAVVAVTRVPDEDYSALIARAARHPLGRLVKLADNWHNLSGLDGLAVLDPAEATRLRARYLSAREVLTAALR